MTTRSIITKRAARAARVLACLALTAALVSCASDAPRSGLTTEAPPGARLTAMAERQSKRPVRAAMDAPPPPGVDAAALEQVAPDDTTARATLSEAIESLRPSADDWIDPLASANNDPWRINPDAARLYVAGRANRLRREFQTAIAELENAARRDPSAAAPWRELGEAHLASGDRLSAVASFRQALRRDPTDVRSLQYVGQALMERRQPEPGAALLSRAWISLEGGDPALPYIVGLALGRALHELGYLAAGNEALREALDLPDVFAEPTAFRQELADVYREAGDAWRDVGDNAARLGDFEAALTAYERAAVQPSLDPGAIALRRVYAAMRLGRPAAAANVILEEILASRGRVEDRHLRLIRYLVDNSDVGPALAEGIEEAAGALSDRERRLAASRLTRARAAATPDQQARAILRARLAESPRDAEVLADLLARLEPAELETLIDEVVRLIEQSPFGLASYTEALLRQRSARELIEALDTAPPDFSDRLAARILRARLLASQYRYPEAEETLRAALEADPTSAAVSLELAILLAEQTRVDEAAAIVNSLANSADPEQILAKSLALQAMGRTEAALQSLAPLLAETDRPEVAYLAAELMRDLGRARDAERLAIRAIQLDPTFESAFAMLIELYSSEGPISDPARLTMTIRELRRALPSSRALRFLRAAELVRARQFDQAERDLLDLAEEEPTARVIEPLVEIWIATGSTDRAERWLREKLEAGAREPVFTLQLARVLAETDRAEEAARILREWIENRPSDITASRVLEAVLRDELNRADEADRMAMRRLDRMPPSLARSLELMAVSLRQSRVQTALEALESAIEQAETPTPDQTRFIAAGLEQMDQQSTLGRIPPAEIIDLHERALAAIENLPVEIHRNLLGLLIREDAAADRLIRALTRTVRAFPNDAAAYYLSVAQNLSQGDRFEDALRVIKHATEVQGLASPEFTYFRVRYAALAAEADELLAAVEHGVARDTIIGPAGIFAGVSTDLADSPFENENEAVAETLHWAGGYFDAVHNDQKTSDDFYRAALRYNPSHALANNNLGYRMLESNSGTLEEIERLLETAFAVDPDSAAIVDSIGWLRYKQGVFKDVTDASGEVIRQGAISLLERAAALDKQDADADPNRSA
ncbi:MAG: tetratricopeptide repeat protein, partial [Planctomycetota bacterium]|nr:tetratricopeptide repeat protein [Planctomycetota bacterium]